MTTATITVTYKVTTNTAPGLVLKMISEGSVNNDQDSSNNLDTLMQVVTASFDPNDKLVKPARDIFPNQVVEGQWLDYTVRFQNTGTDTALNILLIDTLSSNLNLSTLEMLTASHPYTFQIKNKTLEWKFDNIYLPDSNTNELLSHGFVRYRIQMKKTLIQNDAVTNTAYIGFDYNEYVQTNTTITKVIDSVTSICPGTSAFIVIPSPGEDFVYQWQVDSTGNLFSDLTNNFKYSGVNSNTLNIINPSTSTYGFRYRCVATKGVNTVYSWINILKFHTKWTGIANNSWENAANWRCLQLPDAFTDVIIDKGVNNPVINLNTSCRSLKVSPAAALIIKAGVELNITNNSTQ